MPVHPPSSLGRSRTVSLHDASPMLKFDHRPTLLPNLQHMKRRLVDLSSVWSPFRARGDPFSSSHVLSDLVRPCALNSKYIAISGPKP